MGRRNNEKKKIKKEKKHKRKKLAIRFHEICNEKRIFFFVDESFDYKCIEDKKKIIERLMLR